MSSVSNIPLVASRQLTSRPSGSYEINAREYGSVAATAIGLTQAAVQGGENAVSAVVHWSEDGLHALEDGAQAVARAIGTGVREVKEAVVDGAHALAHGAGAVVDEVSDLGGSVAGYLAAGVVAGKALVDELA